MWDHCFLKVQLPHFATHCFVFPLFLSSLYFVIASTNGNMNGICIYAFGILFAFLFNT